MVGLRPLRSSPVMVFGTGVVWPPLLGVLKSILFSKLFAIVSMIFGRVSRIAWVGFSRALWALNSTSAARRSFLYVCTIFSGNLEFGLGVLDLCLDLSFSN